jgi:hypothetical protein
MLNVGVCMYTPGKKSSSCITTLTLGLRSWEYNSILEVFFVMFEVLAIGTNLLSVSI